MGWVVDNDGDIGLTFWGIVTFIKYKHSVIVYWFRRFEAAPKYWPSVREQEEDYSS